MTELLADQLGQGPGPRDRPDVPGYLLGELLGSGASGSVWAAVSQVDGTRVAVKVVAAQAGPAGEPGPLGAELAVLRGLEHPHVVRLYADIPLADGRTALVLELVEGGSLERVVQARGHLTPGETSTILVSLASTAADLHRRGITHADLSPGNVLFHPDGRPMLADLGRARIAGGLEPAAAGTPGYLDPAVLSGEPLGPGSDVYALGALGWRCLTGTPPGYAGVRPALADVCPQAPEALVLAIEAALDPVPARRPGADELAHAIYLACSPEPVALAGGRDPAGQLTHRLRQLAAADLQPRSPRDRPGRDRPARDRRRHGLGSVRRGRVVTLLAAAVLTAVLVVAAVLAGSALTRGPGPPAAASPAGPAPSAASAGSAPVPTPVPAVPVPAVPAVPSWPRVLDGLARARAAAFAAPSSASPDGFDLRGTTAWRSDHGDLDQLRRAGLHYVGVRLSAVPLGPPARTARGVSVRARVSTSAYDVVDQAGRVREHHRAQQPVEVAFELVTTGAGWRIASSG